MVALAYLWIAARGPESNRWSAIGPRVSVGGLVNLERENNGVRNGQRTDENGQKTDL